ncbi:MAG: ABC transporter permease [Paracoccaceae bacterium]
METEVKNPIFEQALPTTMLGAAFNFSERVYHATVHEIRKSSGNAPLGILNEMLQTIMYVAMFYFLYQIISLRGLAIRGDFILFLLTGVFLFLLHNRAIRSVLSSVDATQPIMLHRPMTTMLSIASKALSGLYFQLSAAGLILFFVFIFRGGIELQDPFGLVLPVFTAWSSGIAIGLVFLMLRPFAPKLVGLVSMVYMRANMVTSGKAMPAAYMPAVMIDWFDWNPLFHSIDQARDATFVNYDTAVSSPTYALYFTLLFVLFGLMGEFWMRQNMSASWGNR